MIFPPFIDFEIICFFFDSYKKVFLNTYPLSPHPLPVNKKYKFDDFDCTEVYNWQDLQRILIERTNIVQNLFKFLLVTYQQVQYSMKCSKEQENKYKSIFSLTPQNAQNNNANSQQPPQPPPPPQPPKPVKPSSISNPPPSQPAPGSLFAMKKDSISLSKSDSNSLFKFNSPELEKKMIIPASDSASSSPSLTLKESKVSSRSLISFISYLVSFSTFLVTFDQHSEFRKYVQQSITNEHLDAILEIAKYQSPQVFIPNSQFGPLISEVSFSQQFRFLTHSLVTNGIISENQIYYVLEKIGLKNDLWPLIVPLEHLIIAVRIISSHRSESNLVLTIWNGFLNSLNSLFESDDNNNNEVINSENLDLLLLSFYLLNEEQKLSVFTYCTKLLVNHNSKYSQLGLCRLIMLTDFISKYFEKIPESLEYRLKTNFFSSHKSIFLPCSLFSVIKSNNNNDNNHNGNILESENSNSLTPILYQLVESNNNDHNSQTLKILIGENSSNISTLTNLLNFTKNSSQLISDYYFEICWRFLINLPEIEKYFANIELNSLENNQQLLYLYFVARSNLDSTAQRSEITELSFLSHLVNLSSKLGGLSTDFFASIKSNPRILSLLQGIVVIFESALVNSPNQPLSFEYFMNNSAFLIKYLAQIINNLISILKEANSLQFTEDEIAAGMATSIDLLLSSALPSESIISAFRKLISPSSLEAAREWGSDITFNFDNYKNPSEKIFHGFINISSFSLDKLIPNSTNSLKVVLYNLFKLFGQFLQFSKAENENYLDSPYFELFARVHNDSSLKFLLKQFNYEIFNGDLIKIQESMTVFTLQNLEDLFARLTHYSLIDPLEDSIVILLQRTLDQINKSPFNRNISLLSILNLSIHTQNVKIHTNIMNIFVAFLKSSGEEQKLFLIDFFETLDDNILSSWLRTKLITNGSGNNDISSFLLLLSENSSSLGCRILSLLYNFFELVFTKDISNSKSFFSLVKKLSARHNKYPELILKFSLLLQSDDFNSKDQSDPAHLASMELILDFFKNLLEQILDKNTVKDQMEIVEEKPEQETDLSKMLCTFTVSEKSFIEQHWYHCYTCDLTFSEGVCSVCAKVCHKGHDLSYARKSRFYCDCGAGSKKFGPCKCLQPRASNPPPVAPVSVPVSEKKEEVIDSKLSLDEKIKIVEQIKQANLVPAVINLYTRLIQILESTAGDKKKNHASKPNINDLLAIRDKKIIPKNDLFKLKKAGKGFDVKLKVDVPNAREIKQYLAYKTSSKSAISASTKGYVAIAENGFVNIGYCPKLLENDKSPVAFKSICKHSTNFQVLHASFNNVNPNFLAIAGLKECKILTLNARGEVTDNLVVNLALDFDDRATINQIIWLPDSQVRFAVVTSSFIKVFDLSKDSIAPIHYFHLLDDSIRMATFMKDENTAAIFILTIADTGMIFVQELFEPTDGEPCIMIEPLRVEKRFSGKGGTSIYYSPPLDLVFASYEDGKSFAGRLDKTKTKFLSIFAISKPEMGSFSRFMDLPEEIGTLACLNRKSHCAVGFSIRKDEVQLQLLKTSPSARVDSICTIQLKSNNYAILVLTEDGNVHRFDYGNDELEKEMEKEKEKEKASRKGFLASLLSSYPGKHLPSAAKPAAVSGKAENLIPVDFFEKVECITPQIKLAGDVLLISTSDVAKQKLENSNDFLVSPILDRFTITIQNTNPDLVMTGLRVLVGSSPEKSIPKSISIFDRTLPCVDGLRRWYEFAFTTEESLRADKEFTFTASSTYTGDSPPVIDSIEVYAQTKKDFGWADKIEKVSTISSNANLIPPNQLETCIITTAEILSSYFSIISSEDRHLNASMNQKLLDVIPHLLNQNSLRVVHESAKQLLSSLHDSKVEYYQLIDRIQLSFIVKEITEYYDEDRPRDAKEELFIRSVSSVSKVLKDREVNFFTFLHENPKFPIMLSQIFNTISRGNINKMKLTPLLITDFLRIILGYAKFLMKSSLNSTDLSTIRPAFKIFADLLAHTNSFIRLNTSKILSKIFFELRSVVESTFYQCNSCSNILRSERWHCVDCEDFDLCFKCKNLTSFSHKEHNPAHTLIAIPIDPDSIPKVDETKEEDEEMLLQMALEMSMNGGSNVLDGPLRFYTLEHLFFIYLFEEFNAFVHIGGDSIAYLLLIYSLLTECSYEYFVNDRVDILINTVKQYISLFITPVDKKTPLLETVILLLKLLNYTIKSFSKEKSAEFQILRKNICTELVSINFIGLLLEFLLKLEPEFKKFPKDVNVQKEIDSGRSLLVQTKEVPTESMSPFFRESVVKKYGTDLFAEFKKLLPSTVIGLAHYLIKSEGIEDQEMQTKWALVLCNLINSSRTTFLKSKAKILLRVVCKDKVNYYKTRDFGQYQFLERKFLKLFTISHGFKLELSYAHNVTLMNVLNSLCQTVFARPTNWKSYILQKNELISALFDSSFYMKDESANLVLKLLSIIFIPNSEQKKLKNPVVPVALTPKDKADLKNINEQHLLKRLIRREIMEKAAKEAASKQQDSSNEIMDIEIEETVIPDHEYQETIEFFMRGDQLSRFVNIFLLEINNLSIRTEAKNLIHWMWSHANNQQKEFIFEFLRRKILTLPAYGRNSSEFIELLMYCVDEIISNFNNEKKNNLNEFLPQFLEQLVMTLKSQNLLLTNHPNSFIYQTLSNILDLDGYYLESEPCLVCNDPEIPFSTLKLDSMKLETKYTSTTKLIQFTHSFIIQSISFTVTNINNSRLVKTINLYYNNKPVQDITELRNKWSSWKKVKTCTLSPGQIDVNVEFPIPITATNFMMEYASFYENPKAGIEKLMCPRCNRPVNDKYGICKSCHDNAYQCRQCRNINYEDLNAFLCNECGYSKYAEFNYAFFAKPSFASEKIETDADRDRGMQLIDKESTNAHSKYLQLMNYKVLLAKYVNQMNTVSEENYPPSSNSVKINRKLLGIVNTYSKDCKSSFDSLSKSIQLLMATRKELVRYNSKLLSKPDIVDAKLRPDNKCFGCANCFISLCLSLFENLLHYPTVKRFLIEFGLIQELISNNLLYGSDISRADARRVICLLIKDDSNATSLLTDLISTKLNYCLKNYRTLDLSSCIKNEMLLLSEICKIDDSFWELRLKVLFQLFFHTIQFEPNNPIISEQILLPCLKQIVEFTKNSKNSLLYFLPTTSYNSWTQNKTSYNDWKSSSSVSNTNPDLPQKVIQFWKTKADNYYLKEQNYSNKIENSWMIKLLFNRCSKSVRIEISDLILTLCSNEKRTLQFLDALTKSLYNAINAGDNSVEFFKLFSKLIEPSDRKVRLTMNGFLSQITNLILDEITRIRGLEENFSTDISQGYVLKTYIDLLASLLEVPGIKRKFKVDQLMVPLLDGFLSLRGVIVQKTKYIDESGQQLLELLKALHSSNEQDNQLFIVACVKALEKHSEGRTPIFIFEQLCNIVCPKIPDPVYFMDLTKSQSSEDYIRGSMNKNPYSSTEAGPLMRDVKNKICRDLDLRGLIEDDNGMELLVCDKIIKLDLTVKQVFEHVWKKSEKFQKNKNAPMVIVYRLQGLDVATEEIVDNITDESSKEEDPEIKYKVTSIMSKCGGLEATLKQIQSINDFELEKELATLALNFLYHCLKIKVNRLKMLEIKSINGLLEKLKLVFPKESLADIAELLLLIIESIVSEANEREESMEIDSDQKLTNSSNIEKKMDEHQIEEGVSQMMMFLEKLSSPLVRSNQRIVKSVTRVLPVLTYGEEKIGEVLVNYFLPYLNFKEYDEKDSEDITHNFHLECFTSVSNSIRVDINGMKLKEIFLSKNVVDNLYQYLVSVLPKEAPDLQQGSKSTEEWKICASKRSISYVLSGLSGLTKGYSPSQDKSIEYQIIPGIFQLCSISTKNKIGNLAENLIESLIYNNSTVNNAVEDCEQRSKEVKAAEAKKHRDRVLKSMGMIQDKNKLQLSILNDMDIDEEKGLTCKVCKEGYSFMPNEVIGFYVYSKRVPYTSSFSPVSQIASPKGSRHQHDQQGYCTVTNFNLIHLLCHKEAARADQELKPKKEEWEGAALRNSSTKCNNLFPLFAPGITEELYAQYVDRYWNNLQHMCGRCESTRFRLLAHDLRLLLLRLATESSFAEDSKGGTRETNFISAPFFMQMGLFLLDQTAGAQRRVYEGSLTQFLKQEKDVWLQNASQIDNVCFMSVLSLHLQSIEEWNATKRIFLDRCLLHSFIFNSHLLKANNNNNNNNEEKNEGKEVTEEMLFKASRSMLIYFSIIDKLQATLKKKSSIPPAEDRTISHKLDEQWIESLKKNLRENDYQSTEDFKEILREMEQETFFVFENFDEFFEVSG